MHLTLINKESNKKGCSGINVSIASRKHLKISNGQITNMNAICSSVCRLILDVSLIWIEALFGYQYIIVSNLLILFVFEDCTIKSRSILLSAL